MPIDWVMGLVGGLLIGAAGALFLLVNGRIMGASGILGSLVDGSAGSAAKERASFLIALVAVPAIIAFILAPGADTRVTSNPVLLVAAGLLVGIGTRLANGCTSGHGVCGISRISPRGIVATVIYIMAGAVTVGVLRQIAGVV